MHLKAGQSHASPAHGESASCHVFCRVLGIRAADLCWSQPLAQVARLWLAHLYELQLSPNVESARKHAFRLEGISLAAAATALAAPAVVEHMVSRVHRAAADVTRRLEDPAFALPTDAPIVVH